VAAFQPSAASNLYPLLRRWRDERGVETAQLFCPSKAYFPTEVIPWRVQIFINVPKLCVIGQVGVDCRLTPDVSDQSARSMAQIFSNAYLLLFCEMVFGVPLS
jgi:hypothetical protein